MTNLLTVDGLLDTSQSTHTLVIGIADTDDDEVDSGVFVGGVRATTASGGGIITPVINTTNGDVSPSVFSLSSGAANTETVMFDGGTLQMSGGSFPNNIITSPVTIDSNNGTIDTSTGSGGFSGAVSGAGSLTIKGGNTFSLTGTNTYQGGTVVNQSTVGVGGMSPLGTGTLTLDGATVQAVADAVVGNAVAFTGNATFNSNGFTLTMAGSIAGSGAVTKSGSGVLVLNGDNNYAAGTQLQQGILAIGSGTALGSGTLTMTAGTTLAATAGLTVENAVTLNGIAAIQTSSTGSAVPPYSGGMILDGVVSGTGTLVKTGTTGLRLTAANTYSGGTVIESGHIGLANNQALGTGTVTFDGGFLVARSNNLTIDNAAILEQSGAIDTYGNTLTYAGPISGAGALIKMGDGTLTLSGANSFSGGTVVEAGTLVAGSASGVSPNGPVSIASGATLDTAGYTLVTTGLSGSGTLTNSAGAKVVLAVAVAGGTETSFGGALTDGTGGIMLQKTGAGTQVLAGASTYSGGTELLGGTLAVGSSGSLGSGGLTMADGTTLAFVASGINLGNAITFPGVDPTIDTGANNDTISGVISGPGGVTKLGTGSLDLTAVNTYTGATDVIQGTLVVDGSTAQSFTTVESGAAVGGRGTLGGLNLLSGAVLAPGAASPFATLTINGNATLQAGSTYAVSINAAGQSDHTLVGGTAAINGSKLAVNPVGSGLSPSSRFDILSAAGGVTGTFAATSLTSALPFLAPTLSYSATDVTLGFVQSAPLASAATTPNEAAAARAIDSLGPGNALYNAVIGLNTAGAQQAFQATSGETHASATTSTVTAGRVTSSILFDRLWNLPIPQGGDALDALKQFAPGTPALLNCYAPVTAPTTGAAPANGGYTVWGQAIGDFGHSGSDGNAAAVDRTLGGFMLGLDSRVDAKLFNNWRVGVAGGYTDTSFNVKSGGSGTFENYFGSLYAGARYGAVTLRLGGTLGGTQTNAQRTVAFPGFFESEHSNNGGLTGAVFGEVGYRFTSASTVVEPILNGAFTHVHQDGYHEKGGAAALVGDAQDVDVETTTLGVRGEVLPIATLPVVARLFLGWLHSYGDINPAATVAFASGGLAFSSYGTPLDHNAVVAEVGLDYRATTALSFGLTYFAQAGERSTDNAIKGRIDYRF